MAGTAIVKKAEVNMLGGRLEIYQFSLDPASIAAAAQGIETVAISGARAGDPCWAQGEALEANVLPVGAKVTANDVVSIYIDNNITVTTAVDGGAKTWNLMILKLSV